MYHLLLLDVYHFHHHHHSHCKGFWIPIDWNTCAYILDIISNNLSNCRQPTFDDFQSSIRGYWYILLELNWMHQGSRFALKALMYTGPPTWVSSYSIPIFSHLEVSDLGEPFILHNDQDLVSCLLASLKWKNAKYQYYTPRLFSLISSDNYKHRKLFAYLHAIVPLHLV